MTGLLARALASAAIVASCVLSNVSAHAKPAVEVAFVLDTTGSMAALIEGAKRKIWSIATTIVDENPGADIRMGLVAYRDIGDEYVTKRIELTADIQDLYARLLELKARGGGDWPESVNEALHEGITKLSWTQGPEVSRIVFLVGDAPPHMDYAQDVKYPDVLKIARERDIVVNAVQAGEARDTMRTWREIAQMGNGVYIPIPQDGGKLVVIETPFDVEIFELQE
jgi:Mg-chelatase subunit ChlD